MNKHWVVYYLNADGYPSAARTLPSEQQALEDAKMRSEKYGRLYYVAEMVGRMRPVRTFELERV